MILYTSEVRTMKCPSCGASGTGKFCEYCGTQLESEKQTIIINNYYGANDRQTGNVSPTYNTPYTQIISGKSRAVSLVLCVFVGIFGVHYFYVGKIGMGILYLLTAGLFGIGWLVDVIRIIAGTFRDVDGFLVKEW